MSSEEIKAMKLEALKDLVEVFKKHNLLICSYDSCFIAFEDSEDDVLVNLSNSNQLEDIKDELDRLGSK